MSFKDLMGMLGFSPKARAYIRINCEVFEGAYHFHVERSARSRNLKGWMKVVRLPMYGYIELEVEGTQYGIGKFLEDLNKGPATAKAQGAEIQWKTYKNLFQDFRIRT